MVTHHHHKAFIGIASVVILVVGLYLGFYLASGLETVDLAIVNIGLTFTSLIMLLITGGLVLEVRDLLLDSKRRKK
ncbi:hypothetical protein ISS07_03755 [Candidatus Woesearchaeota archaeon]|nr:hypothetical protein [Candidatus Woesearchaeota archaeon]